MSITPGRYTLGPDNGELLVHTRRAGAAAMAGHDLLIEVTDWTGTLEVAAPPDPAAVTLTADSSSFRVREGTGGIQALGEDDKQNIKQTIDDEVLKRTAIEFRSRSVRLAADGDRLEVQGELELAGATRPIGFEVTFTDGARLHATATVKQSDWGIKPYSALFGTLKVVDEVEVTIDAELAH